MPALATSLATLTPGLAARLAAPAAAEATPDALIHTLRRFTVAQVAADGPDLSQRQLAVFLTCYLSEGPHTVRGLAAALNVSKPAITRALDRLGDLDLIRRKPDPLDGRSVLAARTVRGAGTLSAMRHALARATEGAA